MSRKAWSGKSRFLFDYGKESAEERARWGKQKSEAETAREVESERYNLWSILGTLVSLPLGPVAPVIGSVVGNIAKGVGTWGDEAIESYKMDTSDVGKYDRSKDLAYLEDLNREFEAYDTGEFWTGMKDIGTSILSAYTMGGGFSERGFSPTEWGGKGGQTTKDVLGGLKESLGSLFGGAGEGTPGVGVSPNVQFQGFGQDPGGIGIQMPSMTPSPVATMEIPSFAPTPLTSRETTLVDLINQLQNAPQGGKSALENFLSTFEASKARYYGGR